MTVLNGILIGLLTGTLGSTAVFMWIESRDDSDQTIIDNQTQALTDLATIQTHLAEGKLDIQKNLTSTDLLQVSCSQDWMANHGNLLCREMFCRLQTREGDGAAQDECEQIANLSNTLTLISECTQMGIDIDKCIEFVGKRK